MIILLQHPLTPAEQTELQNSLAPYQSFKALTFDNQPIIVADDSAFSLSVTALGQYPFIKDILISDCAFPLASRLLKTDPTVVTVNGIAIGGTEPIIMAGPCSVESYAQVAGIAQAVLAGGVKILRAGSFKPRSSPYSFQGLGQAGLDILKDIKAEFSCAIISEIMSAEQIPSFTGIIDIFQVGARNMQNYELLKALANTATPVLLKRNPANTIEEWLLSAEYLLSGGNSQVILCERGSKTFDPKLPIAFNVNIVKAVKELTHLPLIVDPSHASGDYVVAQQIALSALIAGADGLLMEVHQQPDLALTDGKQSLNLPHFEQLQSKIALLKQVIW